MTLGDLTIGLVSTLAIALAPSLAWAQPAADGTYTRDGAIAGTMTIDFQTRTRIDRSGTLAPNSPEVGAVDTYTFDINVAETTQYSGTVTRQPEIFGSTLGLKKQDSQLTYNVSLGVRNPRNLDEKRSIGKWVGTVPINVTTGEYLLTGSGAQSSALRFAIDTVGRQQGFVDSFGGRLIGKAKVKESLSAYTYRRVVGGKTVAITVTKSDPMTFSGIELAKGPSGNYPRTLVNGRLDYDYETGNWYTDGIKFKYTLDGKDVTDTMTGSIKWIEDPDRDSNGKGYYEFNLRFNEGDGTSSSAESAAFEGLSEEDAFFAVDPGIVCLTGQVEYVDTMVPGSELPASSKVIYRLNSNRMTKTQLVNFFKLWMLCVGPTNDE